MPANTWKSMPSAPWSHPSLSSGWLLKGGWVIDPITQHHCLRFLGSPSAHLRVAFSMLLSICFKRQAPIDGIFEPNSKTQTFLQIYKNRAFTLHFNIISNILPSQLSQDCNNLHAIITRVIFCFKIWDKVPLYH